MRSGRETEMEKDRDTRSKAGELQCILHISHCVKKVALLITRHHKVFFSDMGVAGCACNHDYWL